MSFRVFYNGPERGSRIYSDDSRYSIEEGGVLKVVDMEEMIVLCHSPHDWDSVAEDIPE